jgi:hypothetical protein
LDSQYVAALAALAGSAIGGLTLLASSWLTQKAQYRADQLAQSKTRREELYKDFIEEASQMYADALQHDKAEIAKFVKLYTLIGRMRVLSSPKVVETAESLAAGILRTYRAPSRTFIDADVVTKALDPFRDFSEACRDDLRILGSLF